MTPNPLSTHVNPAFCARACCCWYPTPLHPEAHCNAVSAGRGNCGWSYGELEDEQRKFGIAWRAEKDPRRAA